MMVAAISETTSRNHVIRPPLLTSEKDHDVITPKSSVKPKTRQVSSRYLSPVSNSRNSASPVAKRSVSVDRRRPGRPELNITTAGGGCGGGGGGGGGCGGAGELSVANKLLVTCTRSLSVSFQGEAFSLPISKTKVAQQSPNSIRKGTPERRRNRNPKSDGEGGDHFENTKPADHQRWPGRIRRENEMVLSRKLSFGFEVQKGLDCRRGSFDRNSVKDSCSDSDSVSSGSSSSGVRENRPSGPTRLRIGPSGIVLSPKFSQETNSRMRRLQGPGSPGSPLSSSPEPKQLRLKPSSPRKDFGLKRLSSDNHNPATVPSSPCKVMMTSSSSLSSSSSSVLSFAVDVRRGKVGENRFLNAHVLRLLYNRHSQWRFINARSEDVVLKQKHSVEENLWNAWITMSDMRDSVTKKRYRLQLLRQKLKLASILKAQMAFLEDWAYLDKDHSISLLGAIEALKASILRLPLGAGATADLQSIKDAVNSAHDVMRAMGSSMRSLGSQVEEVNLIVTEIAKVSAKERALLRICKDLLSIMSALKAKDCSLRTHMLQT